MTRRNCCSQGIYSPVQTQLLLLSVLALYLWGSTSSTGHELPLTPLYHDEAWLTINYFQVSQVNL